MDVGKHVGYSYIYTFESQFYVEDCNADSSMENICKITNSGEAKI